MSENKTTHVADLMPDRPIGSAYEVALLYSLCSEYEKQQEFEDIHENDDFELDAETIQYITPIDVGEDAKVVSAQIDLTEDEPQLGGDPVDVEAYGEELRFKIGYMSNPGKAGAAIDYSVTNHLGSSGQDVETIAYDSWGSRFLRGRFSNWASTEAADRVAENESEYSIVEAMQELSEDEDAMETLENALLDEYESEKELEGFVSVKVKVSDEKGYQYPAEFDELNQVGIETANAKLREGRAVISESYDDGIGMISEKEGTVVGASDGVFAEYGKKQRDAFPDLNPDRGWEQRPLTEPIAKAIAGFNSVEGSFGFTLNGLFMLYLPYPLQTVTRDKFEEFYNDVYQTLSDLSDEPDEYIQEVGQIVSEKTDEFTIGGESVSGDVELDLEFEEPSNTYGLYMVAAEKEQNNVYNIFIEEPRANLDVVMDVNNSYKSAFKSLQSSPYFDSLFEGFAESDFDLMSQGSLIPAILYGSFLEQSTMPAIDANQSNNRAATSDDPRVELSGTLVRGDSIDVGRLLRQFVTKTEREHRDSMGEQSSYQDVWPVVQFMQLHALDTAGCISTESINNFTFKLDDVTFEKREESEFDSRDERLEAFIESHTALDEESARAVFLAGSLVGYISGYQDHNGVSRGLATQYPVSSINRRTIHEAAADVLDKREEYVDVEGYELGEHYTSRLPGVMLNQHPEEWSLTNAEVQWLYSLGIAYGKNDYRSNPDSSSN